MKLFLLNYLCFNVNEFIEKKGRKKKKSEFSEEVCN